MALRSILVALAIAGSACGEFRRVAIGFSGEECSSCAASMTKSLGRLSGITSVAVDTQKSIIELELAAGNRVPLGEMRDAIKRVGFTPGEAQVVVVGKIVNENGERVLKLDGLQQVIGLSGAVPPQTGPAELEGTIPAGNAASRDMLNVKKSLSR